jgi:hypothetical protein
LPETCAPEEVFKRRLHGTIRLADHCVSGDKGHVEAGLEIRRCQAHTFPQQTTYAVTHNGASEAPTRYKAIPIVPKCIGRYSHRQERMLPQPPLGPHPLEIGAMSEAELALHVRV